MGSGVRNKARVCLRGERKQGKTNISSISKPASHLAFACRRGNKLLISFRKQYPSATFCDWEHFRSVAARGACGLRDHFKPSGTLDALRTCSMSLMVFDKNTLFWKMTMSFAWGNIVLTKNNPAECLHGKTQVSNTSRNIPDPMQTQLHQKSQFHIEVTENHRFS